MSFSDWIRPSAVGWWIWVPVTLLFCTYLVWSRISRPTQSYVPLAFTGLWVAGSLAQYVRSDWHQQYGRVALWLGGTASILAVALVPLAVSLITERTTTHLIRHHVVRGSAAAVAGVLVTLLIQLPLALWVARLVERAVR